MKKTILSKFKIFITIGIVTFLSFGFLEGDGGSRINKGNSYNLSQQNSGKVGDAYRLNINNINLPFNTSGTIADVNIPPDGSQGRFGGTNFLFSSGFMISGYTNGNLWAAAQATASRISNFKPGRSIPQAGDDAQMYVILREDPPFGPAWQDWKDAVVLGADFYDGDGDGIYAPVDKNGNGEWDPDEDAPDMLGDATAWSLFNDGIPAAQRENFEGIDPQGIEIRQTVFAFASAGALGNLVFIRYRLSNSGLVAESLDSVYFSVWADPDLGDFNDDLVGVDTLRNAGFTYNDGPDAAYGSNPPTFMIDFFSGPQAYIPGETFVDLDGDGKYTDGVDTPLDTAFVKRGLLLGVEVLPGAKNLPISSFVHYQQSDPILGDPGTEDEARAYMLGRNKVGDLLDPCTFNLGDVIGVDCNAVNPLFWYSGDPVTGIGWINNRPTDQRQMTNTGPFNLVVGEPDVDIMVAYVVGQGVDALSSITVARSIDDGAQFIFDNNFVAPSSAPTIQVVAETSTEFIDFLFPTWEQVSVENTTEAWDLKFQLFNIYTYKTNSEQITIDGNLNRKLFSRFSLDNFIYDVYEENPETGGVDLLYSQGETLIDPVVYADPETGKIRIRITKDPWTGRPLIKGVPYYFAFTSVLLNYDALFPKDSANGQNFGDPGDYVLSSAGFVGAVENVAKIYTRYQGDLDGGVKLGEDQYNPPIAVGSTTHIDGAADGNMIYDVVRKDVLTGDTYEVTFTVDSTSEVYNTYWYLQDISTNTLLRDSSKKYLGGSVSIDDPLTDGFIVKLDSIFPSIAALQADTLEPWFNTDVTDVYYVGTDLGDQSRNLPGGGNALKNAVNEFTRADQLKKVELRFGETGKNKAFRYLMGYVGPNVPLRRRNYTYAAGVTEDNPNISVDLSEVGKKGEGIVNVPFTAWVVDDYFGEYQLAVGFLELSENNSGTPDGIWDPGTDLNNESGEYIFIFNVPYDDIMPSDPTDVVGLNKVHTGFQGSELTWANLVGYDIPGDVDVSDTEIKMASNAFFNILYVMAIERDTTGFDYTDGDKFIIDVDTHPYTSADIFQFQTSKGGVLTEDQERELFNKANVFPNPLYGFNTGTSYSPSGKPDEPFVTFSNLPTEITIKIYSLSGVLLRTLTAADKIDPSSPLLRWNLENESQLRVASGMYLAIVSSPKYGDKILKFAIIMPQKQLPKF